VADSVSIADAKNTLPRLVHEVEAGSSITLTRRGKPVAVLISCAELDQLRRRSTRFSEAYAELLERFDLEELAIDPDEIFARSRDPDAGREVTWE